MIIKIKLLNGHVVDTSFFVNGHYLAKDKKQCFCLCCYGFAKT